jgi:alkanesulfonate monooxygenase SsuD/methylene tetrahydromethanopterin reductase-like flavin-dependent oxidoreductase (luciferase family)
MSMRLGFQIDLRNPSRWPCDPSRLYASTLELCEEAERLGADSVWLCEHHGFDDGYLPQPLTFAAAVAARTKRLRIGTAVTLPLLRSAAEVAEQAAVVDILSAGRFELGIGTGYRASEFTLYGADFGRRYVRLERRVAELRDLWDSGCVTPAPIAGRVPIWLGVMGPQGSRRAGRAGAHLLAADPLLVEPYCAGLAEGGHDPASARMAGPVHAFISDDPERDWDRVAVHVGEHMTSYARHAAQGTNRSAPDWIDPDRLRRRGLGHVNNSFLLATPEQAAEQIRARFAGTPVETLFLVLRFSGMSEALVREHVTTVCTRLAPLISDV